MDEVAEAPNAAKALTWTRATVFRVLWSGWAASVSIVLLATIVVLATPHVRGLGFFPALRYAVITPVAAAFLYRVLAEHPGRTRSTLAGVLLGLAVVALLGMTGEDAAMRLDDITRNRLSRRRGTR